MKHSVLVLIITSLLLEIENQSVPKPNPKLEACFNYTFVNPRYVNSIASGKFINDPDLKYYILCAAKATGAADEENGEMQRVRVKKMLRKSGYGDDTVDEIMKKCVTEQESPEETFFQFLKCAFKVQKDV